MAQVDPMRVIILDLEFSLLIIFHRKKRANEIRAHEKNIFWKNFYFCFPFFHTCFRRVKANGTKYIALLCYASPSHYIFTSELMVLLLVTGNGFFLFFLLSLTNNFSVFHPPNMLMVGSFKLSALVAQPIVSVSLFVVIFSGCFIFGVGWKLNPSDTELINDRGTDGKVCKVTSKLRFCGEI